jgi:hypothetical protein
MRGVSLKSAKIINPQEIEMPQNTYEATIKLPGGGQEKVTVLATSYSNARALLAAQYGADKVMNLHQT